VALTPREAAMLDFERGWWLEDGGEPKHAAVRRCLDMSATSYRAGLDRLIDSPDALAYDPLLVRRLRRRRDERRRARFVGEAPRKRHPR